MISPELYIRENSIQRRDARDLLNEHMHLVNWSSDGKDVVMDVGCGSGDVTSELLKPKLRSFSRLIGADVSEKMVRFARMQYPDLEFVIMDLAASDVPDNWRGLVDHIFSFYCLHWIKDQRQAMKNIFNLLKPGGDMLMCYMASNPIYDVYLSMAKTSRWKPYMMDVNKYISVYHYRQDVEESLRKTLLDVGFEISVCECKTKWHEYENMPTLLKAMNAVNPFLSRIPDNMREQFNLDYIKELAKLKIIEENNNKLERILFPYRLISIQATKPLK